MTTTRIADKPRSFHRNGPILTSYALLALLTLSYGMIGPLLPWLRDALGLSYQQASYHSVAMALGVTGTGLVVPMVAARLGRFGCVCVALLAMSAGLMLLGLAQAFWFSLAASLIIGMALPFAVTVAPAVLKERAGEHTGVAMAEANTVAYLGFLMAPALVSAAAASFEWRLAFLPAWLIYAVFFILVRRIDLGEVDLGEKNAAGAALPAAFWWHWTMLAFSIAAEICIVVWSPSYLENVLGVARERALWVSMAFPLGMLFGRVAVSLALRRFGSAQLTLGAMLLGGLGGTFLLMASTLPLASLGLVLAGFGMAGLYPFGITLAMEVAGKAADRAAARSSLASGVAMLVAPLVVGILADLYGLKAALAVVPLFLLLAAFAHLTGRAAEQR